MIISIIGWYGTETLGDLAILDGILAVLNDVAPECTVQIGSLYPFYTKRTLYEEKEVFGNTAPGIDIRLFDVRSKTDAEKNIKDTDLLMIGGGPLMDLEEMFLLRNCFRMAKQNNIPCIIMGCGVGPLKQERYIEVFKEIIAMSTEVYLRDDLSRKTCLSLYTDPQNIQVMGDPALISVEQFKTTQHFQNIKKKKTLVVNFRDYPSDEYGKDAVFSVEQCRKIISNVCCRYEEVLLVPMHTFHIGGDDRLFLTKVVNEQKYENVKVCHRPMNLYELYQTYAEAEACIGMRYHSVVMQVLLNGNNFIVDYTDPISGKIAGFLDYIDEGEYYSERCWNIRDELRLDKFNVLEKGQLYKYRKSGMRDAYVEAIKRVVI